MVPHASLPLRRSRMVAIVALVSLSTFAPWASAEPDIDAGRRLIESGKLIEARDALNSLLKKQLSATDQATVRELLAKIAEDTFFSPKSKLSDPLIEIYTIEDGDRLATIAKAHNVPYEIIMRINGITDAGRIRMGQKIRIPRGAFSAKVYKSQFRMDLYLNDVYLRSYAVGLGAENGTPEGTWKVSLREPKPTYYPSESAEKKDIIPGGDPKNPLGTHWIGLEGVEGAAVGKTGYGIHGTIEPDSIGKAQSLGCIRMHNEDVAVVYGMLMPGHSTVTTLP